MADSASRKDIVKDKYRKIAMAPLQESCCCGSDKEINYSIMSQDYTDLDGYVEEADLKLGCGVPTEFAGLKKGQKVLDLGSGAGNDVFVTRRIVGETGSVTGLDFTDEMLRKAEQNNEKMGYANVNFVKGDIENIPLPDNSYNVIISNCVLNLVPDKQKAFAEIQRVLKPGGHFCVSDIVLKGELPENMRNAASLYAACVSGAMQKKDYLSGIKKAGFSDVELKSERQNNIPDDYLRKSVSQENIDAYRASGAGIFSITVVGKKPTL